jgi:hypothetical protein
MRSLVLVLLVACERDEPPPSKPPAPSKPVIIVTRDERTYKGEMLQVACTTQRGELAKTATKYSCSKTNATCNDVSECTPIGRARGTVAPGGKCLHISNPKAEMFELGDDCAPTKHATQRSPKGSLCVMESGPGAYCTHDCASDADCADLVRDGFVGACSAGMCLLNR